MKPLEIHCRGKIIYRELSLDSKAQWMVDFYVHDKNGVSFYIFRKIDEVWQLAYGVLPDDIRDACIVALQKRYG